MEKSVESMTVDELRIALLSTVKHWDAWVHEVHVLLSTGELPPEPDEVRRHCAVACELRRRAGR